MFWKKKRINQIPELFLIHMRELSDELEDAKHKKCQSMMMDLKGKSIVNSFDAGYAMAQVDILEREINFLRKMFKV